MSLARPRRCSLVVPGRTFWREIGPFWRDPHGETEMPPRQNAAKPRQNGPHAPIGGSAPAEGELDAAVVLSAGGSGVVRNRFG